MNPRVIKTDEDYELSLQELGRLIENDPPRGSAEADRLELWSALVETYENANYVFDVPDPVDAILFRMEEGGLRQCDLVPYIGSRSKVSEILARKRPLTLRMLRALHNNLRIPAKSLLQEPTLTEQTSHAKWSDFPLAEMVKRGWIEGGKPAKAERQSVVERFISFVSPEPATAFFRRSYQQRSSVSIHEGSVLAWTVRVLRQAEQRAVERQVDKAQLSDQNFLNGLVRLSCLEKGPLLAREYLEKHGVAVVIVRHLAKTRLDGAAIVDENKRPVIGLTLRHDRLDSFWFTLLHELAHVAKHLRSTDNFFVDNFDQADTTDPVERAADRFAQDALIPRRVWKRSDAYLRRTTEAVEALAHELGVHPAIVAGRLRWETQDYKKFSTLIGQQQVRKHFKKEWE